MLPSLFEEEILNEEIQLTRALEAGTNQFAEALDYFPAIDALPSTGDRYLERLAIFKRELTIPVIASLNATTTGGWVRYARLIQEAGADALELNLYHLAADPKLTAADREAMDIALIRAVRASVTIPVAVKLSPFYSALAGFAGERARCRRERPRAVQPVLPAGHRPRDVRRRQPRRAVATLGAAPAAPLDRDPPAAARHRRVARGHVGRPLPAPTRSRRSSWAPTSR